MAILPVGIGPQEGGYQIERSLRFNSADSAYLSRTPASAGNRKTWTWSGWVKRSQISAQNGLFSAGTSFGTNNNDLETISFLAGDTLEIASESSGVTRYRIITTQVFRDPSSWYHVVVAVDTTQATSTNRIKLYINGVQVTAFGTSTYPAQNYDCWTNSTNAHRIGSRVQIDLNGYLTEVNFIDGQALDPTSFGEYNSETGVWQPKAYTGSYGTNGFYLDFADNSSTTALGYDAAGSNDWTPNNFSVTAGAGNDSLVDTPTPYGTDTGVGGEVRGNYATWNPLDRNNTTYSNGNLYAVTTSNAAPYNIQSTIQLPTSGKWYCEVTATKGANSPLIGIGNNRPTDQVLGYRSNGTYITVGVTGSSSSGTPATWTTDDIISIAYDAGAGTLSFYKNGTLQTGGFTSVPANGYFVVIRADSASGDGGTLNAGQRPFAYTAPSGFKALCTQNLPEPTVVDGGLYMNPVLYTGNNSNGKAVTGVGFSPDFIWFKSRSAANGHCLVNRITGVNAGLGSDSTAAEQNPNLASFDADGFTVNSVVDFSSTNANGNSIVAWNWKASGTGVTNTAGTITSTVSANTTAGFSIVTASASGTSPVTVGHGLGVAPKLIIGKVRDVASTNWYVYSSSIAASDYLMLNSTAAKATSSNIWDVAPTSTVFTVGNPQNGWAGGNSGTKTYVFYCFAPVSGYSAFGIYTGNGSTDGPFVYTGFRPRYVLIKRSSSGAGTANWIVIDTSRDTYNLAGQSLEPNLSDAEYTPASSGYPMDILSNGFKQRGASVSQNESGSTYIYAAFAENPFKFSLAR